MVLFTLSRRGRLPTGVRRVCVNMLCRGPVQEQEETTDNITDGGCSVRHPSEGWCTIHLAPLKLDSITRPQIEYIAQDTWVVFDGTRKKKKKKKTRNVKLSPVEEVLYSVRLIWSRNCHYKVTHVHCLCDGWGHVSVVHDRAFIVVNVTCSLIRITCLLATAHCL